MKSIKITLLLTVLLFCGNIFSQDIVSRLKALYKGYTLSMDKSTQKRYHETMAYTVSHGSGSVPARYNISIFPIVKPPKLIPVSNPSFFR